MRGAETSNPADDAYLTRVRAFALACLSAGVVGLALPYLLAEAVWLLERSLPVPGLAELRTAAWNVQPMLSIWCVVGWIALVLRSERSVPEAFTWGAYWALRHGPIASLGLSLVLIPLATEAAPAFSRRQIARFVHADADPHEAPRLNLFVTPGQWCGNAVAGEIQFPYGGAAAALYDSDDPAERARAVKICREVCDARDGGSDEPCCAVFHRTRSDPDPLVRELAAEALAAGR